MGFEINGDCQMHCDTCGKICSEEYVTVKHEESRNSLTNKPGIPHYGIQLKKTETSLCPDCYDKTKGKTPRTIKISFAMYTQEDTEDAGDLTESGWENKEGVEFASAQEAIDYLKGEGATNASCWPEWTPHTWYSDDGETDIATGDVTTRHFHLYGFTETEERGIYDALTRDGAWHKAKRKLRLIKT